MSQPEFTCSFASYIAFLEEDASRARKQSGPTYELVTDRSDALDIARSTADARERRGQPTADTRVGVLARDPYLTLLRDAVRFPDGSVGLYNRVIVPAGIVILPLLGDAIVLIRQFRHAMRDWCLELPRGIASSPVRLAEDAARELEEEAGARPDRIVDLGLIRTSTGMTSETLYLAGAYVTGVDRPGPGEAISEVRPVPVGEFESMIRTGEMSDGPSIAAFARARSRGLV